MSVLTGTTAANAKTTPILRNMFATIFLFIGGGGEVGGLLRSAGAVLVRTFGVLQQILQTLLYVRLRLFNCRNPKLRPSPNPQLAVLTIILAIAR